MTKPKAKPQWGRRLPGIVRQIMFTERTATQLARQVGCLDRTRICKLHDLLNDRASIYLSFREHDDGPSPPEIRAALQHVKQLAIELRDHLQRLDDRATEELWSGYRENKRRFAYEEEFADGGIQASRDWNHVNRIVEASGIAAQKIRVKAGRRSVETLRNLANGLAVVFETFSGKQFSIGKRTDAEKLGAAWVREAIQIIDPSVTETNVTTALRGALTELKKGRAQK